jgi:hypothetical protein
MLLCNAFTPEPGHTVGSARPLPEHVSSLLSGCLHALALAEAHVRSVHASAVSSEPNSLPGWPRPPFARRSILTLAPGLA